VVFGMSTNNGEMSLRKGDLAHPFQRMTSGSRASVLKLAVP
jgi:hypothetical protein